MDYRINEPNDFQQEFLEEQWRQQEHYERVVNDYFMRRIGPARQLHLPISTTDNTSRNAAAETESRLEFSRKVQDQLWPTLSLPRHSVQDSTAPYN